MARVRKRGRTVRKNRAAANANQEAEETLAKAPHSFVIHKGAQKVGKSVQELTKDFRQVMEPYTASNIKVRPNNVVKDFVQVAGMLHVSHLCIFSKTTLGPYLKIGRFPRGPTLTMRVQSYVLSRDVRSALKRQITYEKQFENPPLLIMNGFTGEERHVQLMSSMFHNMFPAINVTKVKVNGIRRCVLLNLDKETGMVEFRHYTIKVVPVGVSKGVKKIVQGKVPDLSRYKDMAEFITKGGANLSESEFEDDENSQVTMPAQNSVSSRGNMPAQQSSVRLVELGPRITMELIKIEENLLDGDVLYHKFVEKTEKEKKAIRLAREKRMKEKERRRKEQDKNVRMKQLEKKKHKERSLNGMKKANEDDAESEEEDDDAKYYEEAVGQRPEKDLFATSAKFGQKRKSYSGGKSQMPNIKRFKHNDKKKREKDVYNSQGVGPNFDKTKFNRGPKVVAKKFKKKRSK